MFKNCCHESMLQNFLNTLSFSVKVFLSYQQEFLSISLIRSRHPHRSKQDLLCVNLCAECENSEVPRQHPFLKKESNDRDGKWKQVLCSWTWDGVLPKGNWKMHVSNIPSLLTSQPSNTARGTACVASPSEPVADWELQLHFKRRWHYIQLG